MSRNGIFVRGDGKFSQTCMVRPAEAKTDNLVHLVAGSELIYQWQDIKSRILATFDNMKRKEDCMANFVV